MTQIVIKNVINNGNGCGGSCACSDGEEKPSTETQTFNEWSAFRIVCGLCFMLVGIIFLIYISHGDNSTHGLVHLWELVENERQESMKWNKLYFFLVPGTVFCIVFFMVGYIAYLMGPEKNYIALPIFAHLFLIYLLVPLPLIPSPTQSLFRYYGEYWHVFLYEHWWLVGFASSFFSIGFFLIIFAHAKKEVTVLIDE